MEARDGRDRARDRGQPADATLCGTPLALLALAGPEAEGDCAAASVRIEGDAEIAQKFRELLRARRSPDLEEELSRVIGATWRRASVGEFRARSARPAVAARATRSRPARRNTCRRKAATCRRASRSTNSCGTSTQLRDDVERLERAHRAARARRATTSPRHRSCDARALSAAHDPARAGAARPGRHHPRDAPVPALRFVFYRRRRRGSSARAAAARGERICGSRSRSSARSSSSSARRCRRAATCCRADVADELAKLQDRVPPLPGAEARAIVERAYGRPVGEVFESFDEAAARGGVRSRRCTRRDAAGRHGGRRQGAAARRARG